MQLAGGAETVRLPLFRDCGTGGPPGSLLPRTPHVHEHRLGTGAGGDHSSDSYKGTEIFGATEATPRPAIATLSIMLGPSAAAPMPTGSVA
jgi:hypothetical protein